MLLTLLITSFLCAAIPCVLFCLNLRLYTPPPQPAENLPAVSILIPARNEAEGIAEAIRTALATRGVPFEIVIMDDASTDATAQIIHSFADPDPRVRYERAPALPPGWNGKQHACWALAQAARSPILCFVDADVRLHPDCIARMATLLTNPGAPSFEAHPKGGVSFLEGNDRTPTPASDLDPTSTSTSTSNLDPTSASRAVGPAYTSLGRKPQVPTPPNPGSAVSAAYNSQPPAPTQALPALVSGFPRQLTGSPFEWLLIPLIHFVLLGFLPLSRMRKTTDPAFAAGCGQFLMCTREAYFITGGHSNIKLTMHDGLRLPKLFRTHGYHTDLADLTPLATVRMYTNTRDTWLGLAKNATEGIAAPARIVPISIILFLGQVLPFLVAAVLLIGLIEPTILVGILGMPYRMHPEASSLTFAHPRLFFVLLIWVSTLPWLLTVLAAWLPRILATRRFRQDWRSALLHPFGILLLLAVQWYALYRKLRGGQVTWRNRSYIKTSA